MQRTFLLGSQPSLSSLQTPHNASSVSPRTAWGGWPEPCIWGRCEGPEQQEPSGDAPGKPQSGVQEVSPLSFSLPRNSLHLPGKLSPNAAQAAPSPIQMLFQSGLQSPGTSNHVKLRGGWLSKCAQGETRDSPPVRSVRGTIKLCNDRVIVQRVTALSSF